MAIRCNSSQVMYPVVIFDDDWWMYIVTSSVELENLVEPAFADEIVHAFDGLARPLEIWIEGDEVRVRIAAMVGDFVALQNEVARSFRYWADNPPPHLGNVESFLNDLSEAIETTTFRRKKRKQ